MSKSYESTPTCTRPTNTHTTSTHKTPSWFAPLSGNDTYCEACGKNQQLEDSLTCSKCNKFFHFSCTELANYELVKYQKTSLYKRKAIRKVLHRTESQGQMWKVSQKPPISQKSYTIAKKTV